MKIIYSDMHQQHQPRTFIAAGQVVANPEMAVRAEAMLEAVSGGEHDILAPADFGAAPRESIHEPGYLDFLETGHRRWVDVAGRGAEIVPNVHPGRHMSGRPQHIIGQAGYYMADTACPIGAGTWAAAAAAANVAVHAADYVLGGEGFAYGMCRPPGHHAFADMAGGFCFLNNVAIAAQHMRSGLDRLAILDIDVHHGNGTQGIFYDRDDVLFVSLHVDPSAHYPWFAGYADERGRGDGVGYNLNLPMPQGCGDDEYLDVLDKALVRIRDYHPAALLVSLGFDAQASDPLGVQKVSTEGFRAMAAEVAQLGLPTVLIQEGGYHCPELGANLAGFLESFQDAWQG